MKESLPTVISTFTLHYYRRRNSLSLILSLVRWWAIGGRRCPSLSRSMQQNSQYHAVCLSVCLFSKHARPRCRDIAGLICTV